MKFKINPFNLFIIKNHYKSYFHIILDDKDRMYYINMQFRNRYITCKFNAIYKKYEI